MAGNYSVMGDFEVCGEKNVPGAMFNVCIKTANLRYSSGQTDFAPDGRVFVRSVGGGGESAVVRRDWGCGAGVGVGRAGVTG